MASLSFTLPAIVLIMSIVVSYTFFKVKDHVYWKIFIIIILNVLAALVYKALPSYMGWAYSHPPPQHLSLQWMIINESNENTNDPGGIYLWVKSYEYESDWIVSLLGYNASAGEPRALKIPYTRKSHEQMQGLLEKLKSGQKITGRITKQSQNDKNGESQEVDVFEQYDLPGSARQRKDYE